MTTALLIAGAVLAALGTRSAAVVLAVAAGTALTTPGPMSVVTTWGAVTAIGLVLAGDSARRLALPTIGMALALVAGAATNSALVLAPWLLATVAAVLAFGRHRRRFVWSAVLLAADVLVSVAVVLSAARRGFVDWPGGLGSAGSALLVVSALVRLPVAAVEGAEEAGLLVVRTQVVVLGTLAISQALPETVLSGLVVGSALVFVLALLSASERRVDLVHEAALVAAALSVDQLGWRPRGWVWGVLAGGTIIHLLRLRVRTDAGGVLRALLDGGGIGLPLLPAIASIAAAALRAGSWVAAPFAVAATLGLAGRTMVRGRRRPAQRGRRTELTATRWTVFVLGALVAAAGLWAPLLTIPHWRGGSPIPWPPFWAVGAVVLAAVGGALTPDLAPRGRGTQPSRRPVGFAWVERAGGIGERLASVLEKRYAVAVVFGALLLLSGVLWALGWAGGFL